MAEQHQPPERRRYTDHAMEKGLFALGERITMMDRHHHERMDKLENTIKAEVAVLREQQERFQEKITDNKSGLITPIMMDLVLLKDAESRRNWFSRTALGAAITAAVLALWALVTGKGG